MNLDVVVKVYPNSSAQFSSLYDRKNSRVVGGFWVPEAIDRYLPKTELTHSSTLTTWDLGDYGSIEYTLGTWVDLGTFAAPWVDSFKVVKDNEGLRFSLNYKVCRFLKAIHYREYVYEVSIIVESKKPFMLKEVYVFALAKAISYIEFAGVDGSCFVFKGSSEVLDAWCEEVVEFPEFWDELGRHYVYGSYPFKEIR